MKGPRKISSSFNWRRCAQDKKRRFQRPDFCRGNSRPLSPSLYSSRPSSVSTHYSHGSVPYFSRPTSPVVHSQPIFSDDCATCTGVIVQPPPPPTAYVTYLVPSVSNEITVHSSIPVMYSQTTYYHTSPYYPIPSQACSPSPECYACNFHSSQPSSPICQICAPSNSSSCDIEDLNSSRSSKQDSRINDTRCRRSTVSCSEGSVNEFSDVPSLRLPITALPCPQDAPGIPIQDSVCPFHNKPSTWSA